MKKFDYDKKDLEILFFIGEFGRTYTEVIGKTFYKSTQSARNRIVRMKKRKLVKYVLTGLSKPKYSIVLPKQVKDLLVSINKDFKPKVHSGSISQYNHHLHEQIAFFHLSKLGDVVRTSVWHHKNVYFAVPDLVLGLKTMNIAIEIEMTQKNSNSYKSYINRASKDLHETGNINRFLFVTPSKSLMITIANSMGTWERLQFIDIDTLIKNIEEFGKIKPFTQKELLKD